MHAAVPTNLRATAVSSRAFTLSWQATNGPSGYFRIYYREQSCSFCQQQTLTVYSPSSRSQRVTGLSPHTTYRVHMTFIYYSSESGASNTLTVTTLLGMWGVSVNNTLYLLH